MFAHGNTNDEWVPLPNPKLHSEDARRVRSERFSANDGLVTMAMALRGTQFSTYDVAEADFEFATIDGARAAKLDHKVDSLTPGKEADIIILETSSTNVVPMNNPLGSLVLGCHLGNVDTVLVAGKVVKRFGKLSTVDMDRVRHLAGQTRDHTFEGTDLGPGFDWRIDSSSWGGAESDKVDESVQA